MKKACISLTIALLLLNSLNYAQATKTFKTVSNCFLTLGFHCIAEYYFIAQNTRTCDLYSGLVSHNLMVGGANLHFYSSNGSQCSGKAFRSYYAPNRKSYAGHQGKIEAICTDSKVLHGTWTSDSLTTGFGDAIDNLGDSYNFTYGWTTEQAAEGVNHLRKQLGCSPIETSGVELRVQGKILRTK